MKLDRKHITLFMLFGIVSIAVGGNGSTCVAILNGIVDVFRINTKVVVIGAVGIIIGVVFRLVIVVVDGNVIIITMNTIGTGTTNSVGSQG